VDLIQNKKSTIFDRFILGATTVSPYMGVGWGRGKVAAKKFARNHVVNY